MADSKQMTPISGMSGVCSKIPGRLPSFGNRRDLIVPSNLPSLSSKPKKTFVPNIPARRVKVEVNLESPGRCLKDHKSSERGRGREGGRGGRGKKNFIQTTGSLFGEGIASEGFSRKHWNSSFSHSSEKSEAVCLQKPVLKQGGASCIDKEVEAKKLKELLRDDFVEEDEDSDIDDLFPVKLPMVYTKNSFKEEANTESHTQKQDIPFEEKQPEFTVAYNGVIVKDEPEDLPNDFEKTIQSTKRLKIKEEGSSKQCKVRSLGERAADKTLPQILQADEQNIFFIQLPNFLPNYPVDSKTEAHMSKQMQLQKQNPGSSLPHEQPPQKETSPSCLDGVPEGRIGTLKIHKSGKSELYFDSHKLLVTKGTQVGFLQDVVTIETNKTSRKGSMNVIGHVGHRLVCFPDFEGLLAEIQDS